MQMTRSEREGSGQNTEIKEGEKKGGKDPQVDFKLLRLVVTTILTKSCLFPSEFVLSFRPNPLHPQKEFHIFSFYLLSGRSDSWAQQPFHQFFLQHDGIHPKLLRH